MKTRLIFLFLLIFGSPTTHSQRYLDVILSDSISESVEGYEPLKSKKDYQSFFEHPNSITIHRYFINSCWGGKPRKFYNEKVISYPYRGVNLIFKSRININRYPFLWKIEAVEFESDTTTIVEGCRIGTVFNQNDTNLLTAFEFVDSTTYDGVKTLTFQSIDKTMLIYIVNDIISKITIYGEKINIRVKRVWHERRKT